MDKEVLFSRGTAFTGKEQLSLLQNSTILIAGMGGLGSIVSELLVRSGLGNLILIDYKEIDLPDINRQSLYTINDIGKSKLEIAKARLSEIHPFCKIKTIETMIADNPLFYQTIDNLEFNGIADCLDNYASRFQLEKLLKDQHFLVHGGVKNDFGQVTTIDKSRSLRLLYDKFNEEIEPIPVVPEIVYIISSIMVNEIIANLCKKAKLIDKLLIVELSDFSQFKIDVNLNKE